MLTWMDEAGRTAYLEGAAERFSEALARAFGIPVEQAREKSRAHLDALFPATGGRNVHHFRRIERDEEVIGDLWFAEQHDEASPAVYLYEIHIHEAHRGAGHGTAAMEELEREAHRIGARRIVLSVFEHNTGAIRLYERLGYRVDEKGEHGRRMSKRV